MKYFLKIVFYCFSLNFLSADAYKAGSLQSTGNVHEVLSLVHEAGKQNVDILVLPSDLDGENNGYDESIKILSNAAKSANIYLVAHLKEKVRCQNKREVVRSNVIFDRNGYIIADYRKPINNVANCTKPSTEISTFSTDFGVTFGIIMEEDLVLKTIGEFKGLKDFVVAGDWNSNVQFLSAAHFSAVWAYINNVNLISAKGIYAGKAGLKANRGLVVVDFSQVKKVSSPPIISTFPIEDLSQYIIKPLDLQASYHGYQQTVCHDRFCCDFHLKTSDKVFNSDVSYGLAVFDGVRHYGRNQYVGIQSCGVFACAGLYKKSCSFGSINNNTNITFEKLLISANFTKETAQYPILLANDTSSDRFTFTKTDRSVTAKLSNTDSVLTFGIFSRYFERDYESPVIEDSNGDIFEYIFNEDMQDFFDYVWIRLRILIIVVSIYVLEMM